ncbi:MAG: gas vesicle protein [bacterium]|nr:gas vesicle protein [bacterium]
MAEAIAKSTAGDTLADVLSLVLDKGIVICGDIQIKLADVDLLTIKIRLLVCGVDKAKEMGIDWWERDSFLSGKTRDEEREKKIEELEKKVKKLEAKPKQEF